MNTMVKQVYATIKVMPLVAAAVLCSPVDASAQGPRLIEGTWDVTVTLRDCENGAPIRSFPRIITFARGGTLAEHAAAGSEAVPAVRGPGHGAWERLGQGEFSYSLKFLRLNAFGGPDGFISETRILDIGDGGSTFSADGIAVITFANGAQSPELCATEEGTKLY